MFRFRLLKRRYLLACRQRRPRCSQALAVSWPVAGRLLDCWKRHSAMPSGAMRAGKADAARPQASAGACKAQKQAGASCPWRVFKRVAPCCRSSGGHVPWTSSAASCFPPVKWTGCAQPVQERAVSSGGRPDGGASGETARLTAWRGLLSRLPRETPCQTVGATGRGRRFIRHDASRGLAPRQ